MHYVMHGAPGTCLAIYSTFHIYAGVQVFLIKWTVSLSLLMVRSWMLNIFVRVVIPVRSGWTVCTGWDFSYCVRVDNSCGCVDQQGNVLAVSVMLMENYWDVCVQKWETSPFNLCYLNTSKMIKYSHNFYDFTWAYVYSGGQTSKQKRLNKVWLTNRLGQAGNNLETR